MTAEALKKLIEQRNNRFIQAVNEFVDLTIRARCSTQTHPYCRLVEACPEDEDPAEMVKQAARDHIPVLPNRQGSGSSSKNVIDTTSRPPMPQIIEELKAEDWYRDQIVEHRSFEKKDPQICAPFISTHSTTLHCIPLTCL
jgi:DEAD/DEAH box helicase domain-containing protein